MQGGKKVRDCERRWHFSMKLLKVRIWKPFKVVQLFLFGYAGRVFSEE